MDGDARRRFARHLSLAEIGEEGQAKLCAARIDFEGDARAVEVAREYARRAGMSIGGAPIAIEGVSDDASAFLAGALAATEAIKRALGVGWPA